MDNSSLSSDTNLETENNAAKSSEIIPSNFHENMDESISKEKIDSTNFPTDNVEGEIMANSVLSSDTNLETENNAAKSSEIIPSKFHENMDESISKEKIDNTNFPTDDVEGEIMANSSLSSDTNLETENNAAKSSENIPSKFHENMDESISK